MHVCSFLPPQYPPDLWIITWLRGNYQYRHAQCWHQSQLRSQHQPVLSKVFSSEHCSNYHFSSSIQINCSFLYLIQTFRVASSEAPKLVFDCKFLDNKNHICRMSSVGNYSYNLECLQGVGLGIRSLSYHISQLSPALFPPFPEPQKLNLDYANSANVSKESLQHDALRWELLGIFSLRILLGSPSDSWRVENLASGTKAHSSTIFCVVSLINYQSAGFPGKGFSLPALAVLTLEIRESTCL